MKQRAALFFHTLRHMTPAQAFYFFRRRVLPAVQVRANSDAVCSDNTSLQPLLPYRSFDGDDERSFSFLNQSLSYTEGELDWCPQLHSRLWRYHLHYFDALRDPNRSFANKSELISSWVASNPQGSQPGWEPYTASLRIVNWVAFFLSEHAAHGVVPQQWVESLHVQVLWLEKNDERHILANHYFENIKALLFAGTYFQGADASRWLEKGQKLLAQQLKEQILNDGGHYERSPHYHALLLENQLDLLNLMHANTALFSKSFVRQLTDCLIDGMQFFQQLQKPDGTIPLFNDSVQNASASYAQLAAYGEGLFGYKSVPLTDEGVRQIHLDNTGLYGVATPQDHFLIDCGDIGPAYQPGHTHCDFLSFELMLAGQPLIVDAGVYEYASGAMRQYVRSTRAHNTVSVNGQEQSEVWGEFRVARRASKQWAKAQLNDDSYVFDGQFLGFPTLNKKVQHRRRVNISFDENSISLLAVEDRIKGEGLHLCESFLHFHPDVILTQTASSEVAVYRGEKAVATIVVDAGVSISIEQSWYCPEFGIKQRNQMLTIAVKGALPATVSYSIIRA